MKVKEFHEKYNFIGKNQQVALSQNMIEAAKNVEQLTNAKCPNPNDKDIIRAQDAAKTRLNELQNYENARKKVEQNNPDLNAECKTLYDKLNQLKNIKSINNKVTKSVAEMDAALKEGVSSLRKLVDLSYKETPKTGAAKTADKFDKGYDKVLSQAAKVITGDKSTKFVEAWARTQFGDKMYDATSSLKNGAADALVGFNELNSLKDLFQGGRKSPEQAAAQIKSGIETVQDASRRITNVCNDFFNAVTGRDSVILNKMDLSQNIGVAGIAQLAGLASMGIGSVSAFAAHDFKGAIDEGKNIAKSIKNFRDVQKEEEWKTETKDYLDRKEKLISSSNNQLLENDDEDPNVKTRGSNDLGGESDDYGADMINEISVVLDSSSSSLNSFCCINGTNYRLSDYSLHQDLLQPMVLNLSLEKDEKIETQSDVVFADASQLIGKSLEIYVSTVKTGQSDKNAKSQKAFVFKGGIIDVSAARATASSQMANITAASWDFLLQNYPHCRSFENMTLNEIVESILKPYSEIHFKVLPRYKKKIPYIVQYNQSDYAFLSMLAARFGEWMYSNGEDFVFGEMDNAKSGAAKLEYPGGSLLSYDLQQNLTPIVFSHILTDYYQYGNGEFIKKETSQNLAEQKWNDWTDKAFLASKSRFSKDFTQSLGAGGFDNGNDEEGADSILEYSLKVEALGKKAEMMKVQGSSKLAMLRIGQTIEICDKIQNKSGVNEDVKQRFLKIISVNHSFDYQQEYSNVFTAVPVSSDYPDYSDANIYMEAPPQRAKVVDNKDPKNLGRIRVQFPWQELQNKNMITPWLRIAVPYAGGGKGMFFVPEIGEEVMVGFEMNNVERPYIIGALYNGGTGKLDSEWASAKDENGTNNNVKAIRTRNGHTILFKDHGNAGSIDIYDNNSNAYHITFSSDNKKITVYSAGEIEINADSDIHISSKGSISMEANKEISIQASRVKVR